MNTHPKHHILSISLIIILLYALTGTATPPPSPPYNRIWSHPDDVFVRVEPDPDIIIEARRDLDNYIGRFRAVCRFLDSMQEHDPDVEFYGGLHEGEGDQLWRIVETDNTQEAIRVWCIFADFFEDSETFRENVFAAWEYCHNYPAWEESEPGDMYGLHNAGWGLIAEMAFRQAYDDSEREYGLRCAQYLIDNTPGIDPDPESEGDLLMPLVAGWAAGTLYEYGNFEDNDEYRDAAAAIAVDVMEWIDAVPDRLNDNEIWALGGGTAMWGVLTALGQADSAETADWAVDRLQRMDVFAGGGQWNNSWNIWYAHAWIAAWRLIDDEDYLANAITIVDSLLAQDGDNDGGIPATGGDGDDRDQSWVTAYTGWMGLSNLFEVLPEYDVRVTGLVNPATDRPWPVGEHLDFSFLLTNAGAVERVDTPFRLRGDAEFEGLISLEGWDDYLLDLQNIWMPDEAGIYEFIAYTDLYNDANRNDDTLRFTLDILPVGMIEARMETTGGNPVNCRFDWYNLELDPDSVFKSYMVYGHSYESLMIGEYRVEVIPDFPYARLTNPHFMVREGGRVMLFRFEHPPVLLVDNDTDSSNASYYRDALTANNRTFYRWESSLLGDIEGRTDYFHTIVYFTGNRSSETISADDRVEIIEHLARGGKLFITGQDVSDDLAETQFLTDVLHCSHLRDDMGRGVVDGIGGDPVMSDMMLLLFGNDGANNQFSKSGVSPEGVGVTAAEYNDRPDTAAAVRWEEESGGRGVFFSFGFEAISGQGNTTDRDEVMASILNWFDTPREVPYVSPTLLLPSSIHANVFPNPSNGAVTIDFSTPITIPIRIMVFDINGRIIRYLPETAGNTICWDGRDNYGRPVPSGVYYFNGTYFDGVTIGLIGNVIMMR